MRRDNPRKTERRRRAEQEKARRWRNWLATEGRPVREVGLPPIVWSTEERWQDFVANGTLHVTGGLPNDFEFEKMETRDLVRLLDFLRAYLTREEFVQSGLVMGVKDKLRVKEPGGEAAGGS